METRTKTLLIASVVLATATIIAGKVATHYRDLRQKPRNGGEAWILTGEDTKSGGYQAFELGDKLACSGEWRSLQAAHGLEHGVYLVYWNICWSPDICFAYHYYPQQYVDQPKFPDEDDSPGYWTIKTHPMMPSDTCYDLPLYPAADQN